MLPKMGDMKDGVDEFGTRLIVEAGCMLTEVIDRVLTSVDCFLEGNFDGIILVRSDC